ncbi:MAG TPA: 50S ribosomal protein L5 [Candidatus Omnitrophota bacterium]|nr:50S ribosomal protein L5 [Candidatus Omnitrophota bacterium]HNQ51379.1 50S ribosomal protein L5 [Candidatus Omnitrophota bacterium]HQO38045.1 50S ribosomal protein L5 [Candidatus Omnitrophota bacterium]HQQ05987.1 50S ribosomal protein L5 [Candidatus Omnitrophota bacterium]
MIPRMQDKYRNEIVPEMMKAFSLKNRMAVPRLDKIVINMGVGEALTDVKILDKAMEELAAIAGQKPIMRRARIAISNFKIKENNPIGCKVTLRRAKMYEFLDRFISVALPRIRDFRGVPNESFDKAGNYSMGLTEQHIFPEIEFDRITRTQGMDITFVIKNSKNSEQSRTLLKLFGMPFQVKE